MLELLEEDLGQMKRPRAALPTRDAVVMPHQSAGSLGVRPAAHAAADRGPKPAALTIKPCGAWRTGRARPRDSERHAALSGCAQNLSVKQVMAKRSIVRSGSNAHSSKGGRQQRG